MPSTPIYGLPFESPFTDQTGITLHGGIPPSSDILAEAVEEELNRVENTVVAGIDARLTDVEAAVAAMKWRHIAQGDQSGGTSFSIPVSAGFTRLRLTMIGDVTASGQPINVRFNGDTSAIYVRGYLQKDSATNWNNGTGGDLIEFNGATTSIKIANWATTESNKAVVEIEPTDGTANPSVTGYGTRISTTNTGHQWQVGFGKYTLDAVVSSVDVFTTGGDFGSSPPVRWYLEGYLA